MTDTEKQHPALPLVIGVGYDLIDVGHSESELYDYITGTSSTSTSRASNIVCIRCN